MQETWGYIVVTVVVYLIWAGVAAAAAGISALALMWSGLDLAVILVVGLASPVVGVAVAWAAAFARGRLQHRDLPDRLVLAIYVATPVILVGLIAYFLAGDG